MRVKTRKLRRPSSRNQTRTAQTKSITIMVFRDSLLEAYVDIGTTSLSVHDGEITVIGLYLTNSYHSAIGRRFDLPFIQALAFDLEKIAYQHELIYDYWRFNLRGDYNAAEEQLGIPRYLQNAIGWSCNKVTAAPTRRLPVNLNAT